MPGSENYSRQIIGNYVILEKLGSGEFGSVYRAQNRLIAERVVAIKLINDRYVSSPEECEHFLQEARVLLRLQHPYILPVIDIGEHQGVPYIVLEYSSRGSLRTYIEQQPDKSLPLEQALTILSQVGQGLHYAHLQNVAHRDLKPDNILFNAKGEALLADFGIATELATSATRNTGTVTGTPPYMAPEQFQGIVSKLSDQYALGCIAYELVTHQKPFVASNFVTWMQKHNNELPIPPRQLNPAISVLVEQAILKAMAKDRMQRFPDVAAFVEALTSQEALPSISTRIVLRSPAGQTVLGSTDVTIGRTPDNTYVLNDPQVSGHHAVIHQQGQAHTIQDLHSKNRLFINEQVIPPQTPWLLKSGDRIRIGATTFEYIDESAAPPPAMVASPTIAATSIASLVAPTPPTAAVNPTYPLAPTDAANRPYQLPPTVAANQPYPLVPTAAVNPPAIIQPYRLPQQGLGERVVAFPPPSLPAPKKSLRNLWIILSVVALVIIIGSVALYNYYESNIPYLKQKTYTGSISDTNFGNFALVLVVQGQTGRNISGDITLGGVPSSFTGSVSVSRSIQFTTLHSFTFDGVAGLSYVFTGSLNSDDSQMSGTFRTVRERGLAGPSSGTWSASIPGS